ncbi:hypothetical protein TNCV_4004591 [Trichonephila clavipes]|nr:hypothetical protein TNCV_4004591 [Trichonephila clavipes]
MGLQFLFMDDNAPCYRTVAAEQLLESEDIERMDWPARSPDLNPIEHERETGVTHVVALVAWRPCIINMAVATSLTTVTQSLIPNEFAMSCPPFVSIQTR